MNGELNKSRIDSLTAGSIKEPAGGYQNKWKIILEEISHQLKQQNSQDGILMDGSKYDLKQITRVYYPPYTLDPEKSTFEDIRNHALTQQRINSENTVNKYLNQAKIMESHPIFRVDFKHPHWTNFRQYMDYIKQYEKASPHTLKNRYKAWRMFVRAWGYTDWPGYTLPKTPDRSKNIYIPSPETVRSLLQYKYSNDKYLNRHIQYHYFVGFMIGIRVGEMRLLDVADLNLKKNDHHTIQITETKKLGDQRILRIEDNIALSKTRKSFKNYVDTIRPRFSDPNETALLTDPKTKKRWSSVDRLRHFLYRYSKKAGCTKYHPHCMRHWCATARCIEWKNDNTVLLRVQNWLGHKNLAQTSNYIGLARLYDQNSGSWLGRALKGITLFWGKHDQSSNERKTLNFVSFVHILSSGLSVPHGSVLVISCWFERINSILSFFVHSDNKALSLNPSSFLGGASF